MLVRAKVGFAGTFSMYKGEIRECNDKAALSDLLKCGYVEEVKGGKSDDGKRNISSDRKRVSKN